MMTTTDRQADQRLLDALLAFVAGHSDPGVARFRDGVAGWGRDWTAVPPHHLPAADLLPEALEKAGPESHALLSSFARERASRRWEQSYTRADGLVGEDMLQGYGFAEVIGKHGPFVSTRVRAGIGVWGPRIDYPPHRHRAEEVYVPLAGSADFLLGAGPAERRGVGDAVFVPSSLTHGFRTRDELLVVFYIWQAGDLRETSTFEKPVPSA